MKNDLKKTGRPELHHILSLILAVLSIVAIVYYGSLPVSYDYKIGSIAVTDIYAPRSFTDTYETERRAIIARENAEDIFVKSTTVSEENINRTKQFFEIAEQIRNDIMKERVNNPQLSSSEGANRLARKVSVTLKRDIPSSRLLPFIDMSATAFPFIRDKSVSMAEILMTEEIGQDDIASKIQAQISGFKQTAPSYSSYTESMSAVLNAMIEPNIIYDETASADAAANAYNSVLNDPVTIDKGARLVESGSKIDEHIYQNLVDLELIRDNKYDLVILLRVVLYVAILTICGLVYLNSEMKRLVVDTPVFYMLVVTFVVPIAASVYLSQLSTLFCIAVFFTAVASTYLGTHNGIILSLLNFLFIWPIHYFDTQLLVVNIIAIVFCAIFAGKSSRISSNASLILYPTLAAVTASLCYGFLNGATRDEFINSGVYALISCIASLVAAVGLSPIYELLSNAASPVKLISLSQPGQHLLKRLFMEASGTYSHVMMVANLADSAAEAIGADALLCKVASYYHDIGKLEAPMYFTENQTDGNNPHDALPVMDSVKIITAHTEDGVKLAKKERLPLAIIKIIDEHHGNTVPAYFYYKACEEAKAKGLEPPDIDNFRYKGHIPSSRESAVVMLADTTEAAVRSKKITTADGAEELIRALVKDKIDHDQLSNSGLSFDDIESIIRAFRQIYEGMFHERIKYPS
ncbi:MAG: HDIG domain-containing protein [Clostridiales bacterium]|nr:HDIG domain-containing protein [Clostridiales bacterium]